MNLLPLFSLQGEGRWELGITFDVMSMKNIHLVANRGRNLKGLCGRPAAHSGLKQSLADFEISSYYKPCSPFTLPPSILLLHQRHPFSAPFHEITNNAPRHRLPSLRARLLLLLLLLLLLGCRGAFADKRNIRSAGPGDFTCLHMNLVSSLTPKWSRSCKSGIP